MMSRIVQIIYLLLVSSRYECSISEEKCAEYASNFLAQKVPIGRPGGASDIGKVQANEGEFPHMVVLGYELSETDNEIQWGHCGASLISENFVLTGAVCTRTIYGDNKPVSRAKIGVNHLQLQSLNVQIFSITKIYIYPGITKQVYTYSDIALLKLNRPVEFTSFARPACLYNGLDIPKGVEMIAIGFGFPDDSQGTLSPTLKKVYPDQFTHEECKDFYKKRSYLPYGILDKIMLCVGGRRKPRNSCRGDAGAPLQIFNKDDNIYEIIGINSFGPPECNKIGPAQVYTRVAAYVPWIESIVWPCDDFQQTAADLNYLIEMGGPPARPACPKIIDL